MVEVLHFHFNKAAKLSSFLTNQENEGKTFSEYVVLYFQQGGLKLNVVEQELSVDL